MIHEGDCLEVMPTLEAETVDAVVTDPPYNLTSIGARFGKEGAAAPKDAAFGGRYSRLAGGFMGKTWDGTGIAFRPETWAECLRLAKPSAYLLAFGGTRTVHRMACAIEDAGWLIRDMLVWAYASGFPKSKASLKPAWEPIVMARKPGPLRELAIDACRIGTDGGAPAPREGGESVGILGDGLNGGWGVPVPGLGRWPANVILTDEIFDGGWDGVVGGGETASGSRTGEYASGSFSNGSGPVMRDLAGDSGTYSRFFLIPKADRTEREPIWEAGLEARQLVTHGARGQGPLPQQTPQGPIRRANHHPTVKPLELMRHLVRLVTPTGGLCLDPFGGSGTTAIACEMEGFRWTLIEREPEYVRIAEARLHGTQKGLGLPA